jgi:PilZ domain
VRRRFEGHDEQIVDAMGRFSEAWFKDSLRFSLYQSQMDRRIAERRPVRKAGMIEFPGGAFSCMVQNLSEAGAALDVPSSIGIPEQFVLTIIERGDAVQCRSVWRTGRQIGVVFETSAPAQSAAG